MENTDNIIKRVLTNVSNSEQGRPNDSFAPGDQDKLCPICGDRGIVLHGDTAVPCPCMEKKRVENRFKYARLSRELMNCSFEQFNLDYYRTSAGQGEHYVNAQKALKAAQDFTLNVIDNPHEVGLLFTGSVGSGKTFLAASIANVLIEKQCKLLFLVVPDLLDELRASYSNKTETTEFDLLDIARTIPILILDDLGAHNYTEWSRNRIYSILNYRMNEQLPTIITTNLDFEDIDQYLGERTCSRLLQMCRIFRLSSEQDIRMQKYVKREKLR